MSTSVQLSDRRQELHGSLSSLRSQADQLALAVAQQKPGAENQLADIEENIASARRELQLIESAQRGLVAQKSVDDTESRASTVDAAAKVAAQHVEAARQAWIGLDASIREMGEHLVALRDANRAAARAAGVVHFANGGRLDDPTDGEAAVLEPWLRQTVGYLLYAVTDGAIEPIAASGIGTSPEAALAGHLDGLARFEQRTAANARRALGRIREVVEG